MSKPVPHGTYNAYRNYKCRCAECKEAFRIYMMAYRRRRGVRPAAIYHAESIRHGATRYRKGCRCEICTAAIAAEKRRYRARRRLAGIRT